MKPCDCVALIAVLLALSYSSRSTIAASIASLEQFRYDFYDNDDEPEAPPKPSSDQASSRSKREDDYGSPYDLALEGRTKREDDYGSPYDLALEGRTKRQREDDYDSPYDLALEGRTKRLASGEPSSHEDETVEMQKDVGKRDYDYVEARTTFEPEPKIKPKPIKLDEDLFLPDEDELPATSAEDDLPATPTPAIFDVEDPAVHQAFFNSPSRVARSDEYDYDEDYEYEESPESASSEESKESCESATTNSPSVDRHDFRKSSSEEDYATPLSTEIESYPAPVTQVGEESYEFSPFPATTEEPEYYTPSSVKDYYTPKPTIERLEAIPSEPIPGSLQDPEIVYDAPNAYADVTMGAQPSGGVVIYPVSPNDLDDRELNPGDTELVISESLVAPPSAGKEYRIAGNVHLEEVPAQK